MRQVGIPHTKPILGANLLEPVPVRPTKKRIKHCGLLGWEYDTGSFMFERNGDVGFFSETGWITI